MKAMRQKVYKIEFVLYLDIWCQARCLMSVVNAPSEPVTIPKAGVHFRVSFITLPSVLERRKAPPAF